MDAGERFDRALELADPPVHHHWTDGPHEWVVRTRSFGRSPRGTETVRHEFVCTGCPAERVETVTAPPMPSDDTEA